MNPPAPPGPDRPSALAPTTAYTVLPAVAGISPITLVPKPPTPFTTQFGKHAKLPPPIPPIATTWIEDTPAGTANGFDPDVNVTEQDTICPDWLHPGGSAASEAEASDPHTAIIVPNTAIPANSARPRTNATSF